MFHHRLSHVVTAWSLGLSVTLGCGGSPTSPDPVPVPGIGVGIGVTRVSPDTGPTRGDTVIRVSGFGFQTGATLSMGGVAAQVTAVTATEIVARTPAHEAGSVEISVTNPDGLTATLRPGYLFGGFSLTAAPLIAAPGDVLTVSWTAPEGRNCVGGGDWIAIYKVSDPDFVPSSNGHSDLWYDHLCGAITGLRTLPAPAQTGEYEFRLMVGDTPVARSAPVTVQVP